MKQELKPCPFCGSEANVIRNIIFGGYSVHCTNEKCGAHVFFDEAEENRSKNEQRWNRRSESGKRSAEPKRGEWIFHSIESPYRWECNKCGDKVRARYNFCPNCGAMMERSEDD